MERRLDRSCTDASLYFSVFDITVWCRSHTLYCRGYIPEKFSASEINCLKKIKLGVYSDFRNLYRAYHDIVCEILSHIDFYGDVISYGRSTIL